MNQELYKDIKMGIWALVVFFGIVSVFYALQIVNGAGNEKNYDTITVDASAEAFASPDIAEVSFSIRSENKELSIAQKDVEVLVSPALSALKELGVEEKDIKTTYYTANPRYEYGKAICAQYRCDDGQRALVGYEVNQSMSVTIRDLNNVGKILGALAESKVSDVYGPNFRVENEDDLKAEVREEAIEKAKEKAKVLAKSLDVKIVGIENFSEGYGGGIYYAKAEMGMAEDSVQTQSAAPTLPQGENKIETTVTITYRVK
ncbi:MAG: uncharacterized protein QG551_99 [Patescibacteria group bacterium]|jgi:uncharacterized protein YggE|nr:uncharacterized protein [Patescibacteria group bacterium]